MEELLEVAMHFSDDRDDDEDNEMDWSSEEDELMKGAYSHFQGEVFPDCKADAARLMAMSRNLEASSTTMSTRGRDITLRYIYKSLGRLTKPTPPYSYEIAAKVL